jgi:segregation and condensation protein A
VLERRKQVAKIELKHEQFTIAQMMERLRRELLAAEEGVGLLEFFDACPSRHAMIVAFLAMLEMVRMQAIVLTQKEPFGEIRIRKHRMFEAVFSEHGAVAKIEEQYL